MNAAFTEAPLSNRSALSRLPWPCLGPDIVKYKGWGVFLRRAPEYALSKAGSHGRVPLVPRHYIGNGFSETRAPLINRQSLKFLSYPAASRTVQTVNDAGRS